MSYLGQGMSHILLWGLGLLAGAIAIWQFYLFVVFRGSSGALEVQGGGLHLLLALGAAAVTCACVFTGIFRRINKTEEFHITS